MGMDRTRSMVSVVLRELNSRRVVSISYSKMPAAKMSAR